MSKDKQGREAKKPKKSAKAATAKIATTVVRPVVAPPTPQA